MSTASPAGLGGPAPGPGTELPLHAPGAIASRDLLLTMIERKLRLRMKRTWVGTIWPIIAPVFLFGLYVYVFHTVFKVPQPRYGLYLFIGLLPWTFLAQTLGDAVQSMSNEAVLIRRSAFHHELLPIASVVTMSLYFLMTLIGLLVYLACSGRLHLALLPMVVFPVASLYLLVGALAIVLALIDCYNRDLRQVLGNILTIWFFLVPIVYRPDMVSDELEFLRSADPASLIVGQFRQVLFYGQVSQPSHVFYTLAVCGALFAGAVAVTRRASRHLAKDI
jgi:ABC-type polysaccharide/polyol phosphate export permease